MTTKYFVSEAGEYLGAFSGYQPDPVLIEPEKGDPYFKNPPIVWPEFPEGGIEVSHAPDDARQIWLGDDYGPVPETVPDAITPLQGLRAIEAAGLSAAYSAWAVDPERTFLERAFIEKAQTWRRDDPVLLAGAVVLGLSDSQLDELFIQASKL